MGSGVELSNSVRKPSTASSVNSLHLMTSQSAVRCSYRSRSWAVRLFFRCSGATSYHFLHIPPAKITSSEMAASPKPTFQSRYFARLNLSPDALDASPTPSKLSALCRAHLAHIPFGNLGQHGGRGGAPVLDVAAVAEKVLDRRREGLCFELNLLFAHFLQQLGYDVVRVKASVCIDGAYVAPDTHVVLVVVAGEKRWLVDVAFGEPALEPLSYEMRAAQTTCEGMESRMVEDGEFVMLEWRVQGSWQVRMRWAANLADGGDFQQNLERALMEDRLFAKKLIVCKISEREKVTLAANLLKITGPPRFGEDVPCVVRTLKGAAQVREVLEHDFGIPLAETEGLTLEKSLTAPPDVWSA